MDNLMRKLPIGIQTFEGIRKDNYLYVDKTALIWRMKQHLVSLMTGFRL